MKKISSWFKKYFIPHSGNGHQPHFLRHQSMMLFFFLIIIVQLGFLVQVFVVFDKTKFLASVLPGILSSLTNEQRLQNDLPPLTENSLLDRAAQMKADDMAKNSYFAHTSPTGVTPWYWFDQVGYRYQYAGENLAVNFFESEDVANAWMNSPTHRANIVKKNYTEIGIGVANGVYEGRSTVFVAQLFGAPLAFAAPAEITLPEAITPVSTPATKPAPKAVPVKPAPKTVAKVTPTNTPTEPAKVAPVVTPVIAPVTTKILGEETVSSNNIRDLISRGIASIKLFTQNAMTSPAKYMKSIYGGIALLFFVALSLALFIKSEFRHPIVVMRGVSMMAVIVFLLILNLGVLRTHTEVPTDTLSASVVAY